jgi:hypothetical protein
MTPQERQMVDELFGRLATLENAPRDPDAERAVLDGLRHAPNATYALVQTVLVQDEALKRANDRIQELEDSAPEPQPSGGFLDSMRSALSGQGNGRGSVPSVRPGGDRPTWNSGQVMGGPQAAGAADPRGGAFAGGGFGGGGSSFLGTAAAAATGVIGGSLLMNGIRNLMGGSGHQQSFGDSAALGNDKSGGPWGGGNDASSGNMARDAGINDIGKTAQDSSQDNERRSFADNSASQRDDNAGRDDGYGRDDYASNDGYGDDEDYGDDDFDDGGDYA